MSKFEAMIFIKEFLSSFVVNLEVAIGSLLLGLVIALPLTYVRRMRGVYATLAEVVIAFFRAFPVFVLLYVLFNASSYQFITNAFGLDFLELVIVILALSAYSVTAVSDAMLDSWKKLDSGDLHLAMLFIPNCFRIFTILILASSIGAAIGLRDSVAFSIHEMDLIEDRSQKILLLVAVCLFYVVFLMMCKGLLNQVVNRMTNKKSAPRIDQNT